MVSEAYEDAWKAIIRPKREAYTEESLGNCIFFLGAKKFQRTDYSLKNERGLILRCSFFEPSDNTRVTKELPCVVYVHGNTSSRLEALHYIQLLLPSNISLFCFDSSGSGLSGGEYISLGWWERDDLKVVLDFLRSTGRVAKIALWGRSMGAVTALMQASRDPAIAGMVLDSPFSDLRKLIEHVGDIMLPHTPTFMRSMLIWFIKRTVNNHAHFNIDDLIPLNQVEGMEVPTLFIVADGDTVVPPEYGVELYEKYGGPKNILKVPGNHNTGRPTSAQLAIYEFFCKVLQIEELPGYKVVETESDTGTVSQIVFPVFKVLKQKNILNNNPDNSHSVTVEGVNQLSFLFEPEEEMNLAVKLSLESFCSEEKKRKDQELS